MKLMDQDKVVAMLKRDQGEQSLRQYATKLRCSHTYLADVLARRTTPGPKILRALGLRRIVAYTPSKK